MRGGGVGSLAPLLASVNTWLVWCASGGCVEISRLHCGVVQCGEGRVWCGEGRV